MKRINKFVFIKIVRDYPAKLEVSDPITGDFVSKTQSEIEKCENLCGSEKIETTNDVNEDNDPIVSSNYDHTFDLNHENPSYCNSSTTSECNLFMGDDLKYNNTTIQEEDPEDSEKTIKEEFLVDNRYTNSLSKDFGGLDPAYEKIQVKSSKEKFVNSEISLNSINVKDNDDKIVDNYVDSRIMTEESVPRENIEEEIKNKETRLERNPPRDIKELDFIENKIVKSNIESNDYYIDNNKRYLKDAVDLLKCTGENTKHTLNIEEDSIERTITEIKEMDKIIKNILYTNDDEQHDSVEERMVKSLSAELKSDDVIRKIIENCSSISTDFQQHLSIRENSTLNFEESSSEYVIKNFQENKLFSHYRDISDTAIEKEDILKTIKEAEKILTDNPYPEMSEASVNENYVRDNLLEKSKEGNDEECKTVNKEENNFVENKNTEMDLENVKMEKVVASKSNVNSNLQKLAEITCSDRPRSHIEIHETLEKIAEEKRKIEDRKKDSLETLSKKFEEIDKFIANRYNISYTSDKDPREFKIPEDFANDSDSLDFQDDDENVEVPLTKAEIIENLKIEELEKELASEMEEHKKLMDEYQKIIATDLEEIQQATLEFEAKQICDDEKTDEETANQSKNDKNRSDELNQMPAMIDNTTIKIDSESDNSFSEDLKEPERTYIKGKVYDFDEKKHGVR